MSQSVTFFFRVFRAIRAYLESKVIRWFKYLYCHRDDSFLSHLLFFLSQHHLQNIFIKIRDPICNINYIRFLKSRRNREIILVWLVFAFWLPHLHCLSVFVWNCAPQGEQGIAGERGETGYTGDKVPLVLYKLKKKKKQWKCMHSLKRREYSLFQIMYFFRI